MTIRHFITLWLNWRNRKAMRRAVPILRDLDIREAEYRRQHRRGSAAIIKAKKQAVCRRLANDLGREWV